jgi:uncharacterized protein (DUF3084 family)
LTPDNIASSLQALTKLLKDIPLAKIPEYVEEKKKEIKSKEEDIQTLTQKFVQVIYGIKQHGYDINKVLSEYSDLEFKQVKRELLNNQVRQLEDKIMNLQHQCSFLESKVNLHDQRLYVYDELKLMGLGLRQLKIICNKLRKLQLKIYQFIRGTC